MHAPAGWPQSKCLEFHPLIATFGALSTLLRANFARIRATQWACFGGRAFGWCLWRLSLMETRSLALSVLAKCILTLISRTPLPGNRDKCVCVFQIRDNHLRLIQCCDWDITCLGCSLFASRVYIITYTLDVENTWLHVWLSMHTSCPHMHVGMISKRRVSVRAGISTCKHVLWSHAENTDYMEGDANEWIR